MSFKKISLKEKLLLQTRMKKIEAMIKNHQSTMKRLIAFAIGEKLLKPSLLQPLTYQRTEEDDKQLLISLRSLRKQIHSLRQALASMTGDLK